MDRTATREPGPARRALAAYSVMAVTSRSVTEAIGPALLLTALASGRLERDGALVLAAFTGLAAVSGPLVGALLDRARRPGRVIVGATLVLVVVVAVLAWLIPTAPVVLLAAVAAVGGFAHPALTGGLTAQLPSIVPASTLDRAYGVDAATYNIGAIVGPPLAAAAVVLGARGPVLFTLALLVVSLIAVPRVPFPVKAERGRRHSLRRDVVTGFRALGSTPPLAFTTLVTTVGFAGQAAFLVAVPLVTIRQTGSLAQSGLAFGAAAAGGVLATLALARRPLRDPDRAVVTTTLLVGLSLAVLAFSPVFAITVVASFLFGASDGPMLTAMFRIRTREAAPGVRSAVFTTAASLRTSVYAAMTAVFGALVASGPQTLLLIGAALHVVAVLLGYAVVRQPRPAAAP